MRFLRSEDLYDSLSAGFIRVLRGRLHRLQLSGLIRFCKARRSKAHTPELRQAAISTLISHGVLNLRQTRNALREPEWWVRSTLIEHLKPANYRRSSFTTLVNGLLRDRISDVAVVASDVAIAQNVTISKPRTGIRRTAQFSLKAAGLLGRITRDTCPISEMMVELLGANLQPIAWTDLLGCHYQSISKKIVQWGGYAETDPTAWVHLTDTMNDCILDSLYVHDPTLGSYSLGHIGGVLQPGNRLARRYPLFFRAVDAVHSLRLESYLAHPAVRRTGRRTRPIRYEEMEHLFPLLTRGYYELWNLW
jgi:hypothetical protein